MNKVPRLIGPARVHVSTRVKKQHTDASSIPDRAPLSAVGYCTTLALRNALKATSVC